MNDQIRKYDDESYLKFTLPSQLDKEIHYLDGIVKGITIDGNIGTREIEMLKA